MKESGFAGRFDDINETHDRLRLIIEWYNAWTLIENNITLFIMYMIATKKQKYLVPLAKGEKIGAFCLSEPEAGSDATSQKTTAIDMGDHYLLNGTKNWITNGSSASTYLVIAQTDVEAGPRGLGAGDAGDQVVRLAARPRLPARRRRVPESAAGETQIPPKSGEVRRVILASLDVNPHSLDVNLHSPDG